jgi:hypothetical protein
MESRTLGIVMNGKVRRDAFEFQCYIVRRLPDRSLINNLRSLK